MTGLSSLLDSGLSARAELIDDAHLSAFRLFNGFLEGYPALSLDIYGRTALIHNYSGGPQAGETVIARDWLVKNLPWLQSILLKTRESVGSSNSLGGLLYGKNLDRKILENGVWYALDLNMNRDASFYMDTRNLRAWIKNNLAGKSVLNAFAYTGSLGIAALAGGAAHVTQLDRNPKYLNLAVQSSALNGIAPGNMSILSQDFFPAVGRFKHTGQSFDCVFLDPPFFASTSKGTVDLETGSTRLINKVRPLVNDGGWLVTINNALFVSGADYFASLQALCADGYLAIEQLIPVPPDFTGYPQTISAFPPADPAPFNHSTKIAILRVKRKSSRPAQSEKS